MKQPTANSEEAFCHPHEHCKLDDKQESFETIPPSSSGASGA